MNETDAILELPGITVTRESITVAGHEVAVDAVEHPYIEVKGNIGDQLLRFSGWLFALGLILLVVAFANSGGGGPGMASYVGGIVALVIAVLLVLVAPILMHVFKERRAYEVQVETTRGTLTVYTSNDHEEARQVCRAVRMATGRAPAELFP